MKVTIATLGLLLVLPISFSAQQAVPALKGVPQFTAAPKWPTLPADFTWGQVIGIFADSKGHVWTSSRGRISEWDPSGKLVQSWDARGPDGKWNTIHGLFVDHNGFVWTNARESNLTVKFTRTGQVALVIGKFDQTGGSNDTALMGRPSEIWVDPADNEVFVADGYGNRRIIVFDGATGKYLRHWGAYGKRPEDPPTPPGAGASAGAGEEPVPAAPAQQFRIPHGIIGSRDGLIYLADRANNRIQVFRQSGEYDRREDPQAALRRAGKGIVGAEAAVRERGHVLTRLLARRAADLHLQRRRRFARDRRDQAQRSGSRERVRRARCRCRSARPPPQPHRRSVRQHLRGRS